MPRRRRRCRSCCGAPTRSPSAHRTVEPLAGCTDVHPVTPRFSLFVLRRAAASILLVLAVASAAHLLAGLAPGDHLSEFEMTPAQLEAERHRLGRDRPLYQRYADWLEHALRLDLGQSSRYP